MKKLITLVAICFSAHSFSQLSETEGFFNINMGVAIYPTEIDFAETHKYDIGSIYQNHVSFVELAISTTDYGSLDSSYFKTGGAMTFKYFYPNNSNDSISSRYAGNLFGFDLVGLNLLPKVKFVDFLITGGVNMGSKKVRVGSGIKYKNFIFAPKLTGEIRFKFGKKFSIAGRVEQQWDITNPRWKLKKGNDVLNLTEMRYNPLMISAGLGWTIL